MNTYAPRTTYTYTGRVAKSKANRCASTIVFHAPVAMRRERSYDGKGWVYYVDII